MDNFINPKDLIYPVGSVYVSKWDGLDNCSAHDPALVFGGQWQQIVATDNSSNPQYFYNKNVSNNVETKVKYYLRVA